MIKGTLIISGDYNYWNYEIFNKAHGSSMKVGYINNFYYTVENEQSIAELQEEGNSSLIGNSWE